MGNASRDPFDLTFKQFRNLEVCLSQKELADKANVGKETISRIERGETTPIQRTVRRIASTFDEHYERDVKAKHVMAMINKHIRQKKNEDKQRERQEDGKTLDQSDPSDQPISPS